MWMVSARAGAPRGQDWGFPRQQLKKLLNEFTEFPFEALGHMAEADYGGQGTEASLAGGHGPR